MYSSPSARLPACSFATFKIVQKHVRLSACLDGVARVAPKTTCDGVGHNAKTLPKLVPATHPPQQNKNNKHQIPHASTFEGQKSTPNTAPTSCLLLSRSHVPTFTLTRNKKTIHRAERPDRQERDLASWCSRRLGSGEGCCSPSTTKTPLPLFCLCQT